MGVELDDGGYGYFTRYADYDLLAGEFWAPGGFVEIPDSHTKLNFSAIPVVWSALAGKNVWFYTQHR